MKRKIVLPALGAAASLLGLYLLYRVVHRYDMGEIMSAVNAVPARTIILALLLTALGYVFLVAGEFLAVLYIGREIPRWRVARTAIAALGIGHSIGLSALSSGAVRYRMYGRAGLDFPSVGRIILFSGATVALGMAAVGSAALLWHRQDLAEVIQVSPPILAAVAAAAMSVIALYLAICAFKPRGLHIGRFHLDIPSLPLASAQIVVGSSHLLSVSAVLYASLHSFSDADYPTVAALYVGADMSALVGHVPGGWGVIEYLITSALEGPQLLAGLIIFRATYYLLPLAVGVVIFVIDEAAGRRTSRQMPRPAAVPRH